MNDDIKKEFEDDEDYEPEIISLTDESGKEYSFEILDEIEENNNRYIALIPSVDNPEELLNADGELVVMKEVEEDGEFYYDDITDEKELEKITGIFTTRLEDYYKIIE